MINFNIILLPTAKADLNEMVDYLSQFYPSTALKQYDRIIEKINQLKQFPLMCEEYQLPVSTFQYRRMVVDNYLVFYVVYEEIVEIHNILNSRMNVSEIIK